LPFYEKPRGDEAVTGLGQTLGTDGVRSHPLAAYQQADLSSLKIYMLFLMMRNITSSGFVFEDPAKPGSYSLPGSVLAAPSYPANTPGVDQDYVFNWVRDSAITMIEIAEARLPSMGGVVEPLNDYVTFATTCYNNAVPTKGHACFTVVGQSRNWTEQNDGPALQTLALMRAFGQLDQAGQQAALALMNNNVTYLLENDNYKRPTVNLWEEHSGLSFFARSAQLKCLRAVVENTIGLAVPPEVKPAIAWLENALNEHWNGSYYVSLVAPGSDPPQSVVPGYDANIDIVQASVYGAVPCTDTKMLATAGLLQQQWSDPASQNVYPINIADQARGIGPLFGRYPGDVYDGDVSQPVGDGHP
jgi:glucoamylase